MAFVSVLTLSSLCRAETLAYWRFEDHPVDDKLDAELGTAKPPFTTSKSIDDRNALRTFNTRATLFPPDTCPTFVAPPDLPKLAGDVPNERSARFVGSEDFYTTPEPAAPIDAAPLKQFTIEGMFKLSALSDRVGGRFQTIVGKDGKPVDRSPFQPLVVVVGGKDDSGMHRDCLSINILDAAGNFRVAASTTPLEQDHWYAFAAVCNGATMTLFINRFDGRGYQPEGETNADGGLIASTGTWTVGRGMFDRAPNSWLQGYADEIRISDAALPPAQFITAGVNSIAAIAPTTAPAIAKPTPCVADLADPAALLHDGVYYLYGTGPESKSFGVWSSRDLQHWERGATILAAGPGVWGDEAFWAPGVVERGGKVYLYYSSVGPLPDTGGRRSARISVAVADSPGGPFKEIAPHLPLIGRATIDPEPFIDADGKAYLYFVADINENNGSGQIYVVRLADDLITPVGEPIACLAPSQPWEGSTWNEGPAVFRDGDTYVLMYSGDFWASPNYSVGLATAPSPLGPWKKSDTNPFLSRYAGLFGTGHNAVVHSPDGKGWLTFFHAHRAEGDARRDVYLARLVIGRDARQNVTLTPRPWQDGQR